MRRPTQEGVRRVKRAYIICLLADLTISTARPDCTKHNTERSGKTYGLCHIACGSTKRCTNSYNCGDTNSHFVAKACFAKVFHIGTPYCVRGYVYAPISVRMNC